MNPILATNKLIIWNSIKPVIEYFNFSLVFKGMIAHVNLNARPTKEYKEGKIAASYFV
jgi:hypothetical protein